MLRVFILLGILAVFSLLTLEFPYVLHDEYTRYRAFSLLIILMVLAARVRPSHWQGMPVILRNAVIWLAITVVMLLAYSFRDDLKNNRLIAGLLPRHVQINGNGTLQIHESIGGQFFINALVNDVPILFLVDTGASDIVLSPYDAARVGFLPETLEYSRSYTTANGYGKGAPVTLKQLEIGSISLNNMPAAVNKAEMSESLLGMSFLRQLKSFRFEGDTLILTP